MCDVVQVLIFNGSKSSNDFIHKYIGTLESGIDVGQGITIGPEKIGQKSCIFGPTIFKTPQPNWH